MDLRTLAGLAALTLGVALSREARAECTTDIECKGERICVEGVCVDPPATEVAPAPPTTIVDPPATEVAPAPPPTMIAEPPAPPSDETPAEARRAAPRMERRSTGLFVAGIVSLALVPVAGTVAFWGAASKSMCTFDESSDAQQAAFLGQPRPRPANCGRHDATIYGGLAASAVLLGGGLTMLLVGVKKVPVERASEVSVRPLLSPTVAGVGLSTSF
ncbi:MAG: hypothetical protein KF850_16815 [Labilithrix sp.]|nr:hypothetical protein [Labilithrix sp.]